jgi:hypothetical protein
MRRILTALFLAMCAVLAVVPAVHADSLLFDYVGFDYEFPNPNPATFGEPGSGYVGVGMVPVLGAPLVSNTSLNEYTYVMQGFTPSSVVSVGPYDIINYTTGVITIYEDALAGGTTADYGVDPPNATAPNTFNDGTAILVGTLTSMQFMVDRTNGTGSYDATFNVTGGSQLGNFPVNQRVGWTFSGSTGNALNIPHGYAHQCDGQTFLNAPVGARKVSWGKLKAGYR